MHGSVCIRQGIVYVGNHARSASVRTYDLDGHRLESGFAFGPSRAESGEEERAAPGASATGLAVDDDHRVWVADPVGGRVRAFTLFGAELDGLPTDVLPGESASSPVTGERQAESYVPSGVTHGPVDVAAFGVEQDQVLLVGVRGGGRHAVRRWSPALQRGVSLRSFGDPKGRFQDVVGVALDERLAFVCEARPRRVQVFRDFDYHFTIEVPAARPGPSGALPQPRAIAALPDGRLVLALAGEPSGLLLLDSSGRLLRVLAEHGEDDGEVFHPSDVALEDAGADDRHKRLVVIDREGERVQVFTVAGTCYGAFDV